MDDGKGQNSGDDSRPLWEQIHPVILDMTAPQIDPRRMLDASSSGCAAAAVEPSAPGRDDSTIHRTFQSLEC